MCGEDGENKFAGFVVIMIMVFTDILRQFKRILIALANVKTAPTLIIYSEEESADKPARTRLYCLWKTVIPNKTEAAVALVAGP